MESFNLTKPVKVVNPTANIDGNYGTYATIALACAEVLPVLRLPGRTVGIIENGSVVEYWWKSGVLDSDLVLKVTPIGYTPEDIANKSDVIIGFETSVTKYPTIKALFNWVTTLLATKQNTLTNPITGIGAANNLAKFTGSNALGNSQIFESGVNVGVGENIPTARFHIASIGTLITDISFRIRNSLNTLDIIRTDGLGDVYIGEGAGRLNTAINNLFIGRDAGAKNNTALDNMFVGPYSGRNNLTGHTNTFLGSLTGDNNTSGFRNVFVGYSAGRANTSGNTNVFIGTFAGQDNNLGFQNTFIGYSAAANNTSGNYNTALGNFSGVNNLVGINNVYLGYNTARFLADEITIVTNINSSVFLGSSSKPLGNSQTNQIVIGYAATGLGSNTTVLGNSSIITTAIYGNLLLGKTSDVGGKLQIVGETQTGTSGIGILNLEQTWDTTAAPTAIKLNVTNTASNAVAKLMDLQVGGVSRFYVDRLGNGRFSDGGTASVGFGWGGGTSVSLNGTNLARTSAGGVDIGGNFSYINFITNNASAMIIHTTTKDVSINTTLDIGAKFQVVGKSMLNGTRFFGQPIPEALIASTTLNENQITKGIITVTNTVPTSFILPTGTGLDGNLFAFSLMSVDTGLDYTFINLGTAIATITSGTDNPLVGNGVVNVGSSATFRTVKRATNVFITYRIS